MKLTEGYW